MTPTCKYCGGLRARVKELEAECTDEAKKACIYQGRSDQAEARLAAVVVILHRPISNPLENSFKIEDALRAAEGRP